jgi:uncharacterized protein (UPF0332 family)
VKQAALMTKARTALASAKVLLGLGDTGGATNRAYYAMFDAALAALLWADIGFTGKLPKTHTGVITAFGLQLVEPGHLAPSFGRSLNRVEDLRLTADYLEEALPQEAAAGAVAAAEAFVDAIAQLLTTSIPHG